MVMMFASKRYRYIAKFVDFSQPLTQYFDSRVIFTTEDNQTMNISIMDMIKLEPIYSVGKSKLFTITTKVPAKKESEE